MARYSPEHKAQTRRRIVEAAGRRLRTDGIVGSGVSSLMADADLTNGAFYAHFASKDDLVATVITEQLAEQRQRAAGLGQDPAAWVRFVSDYLSAQHRDRPDDGCPSAALISEVARSGPGPRRAYSDGLVALADELAAHLAGVDRVEALQLLATLYGTLQVARALADPALSQQVLERGVATVLGR